MNKIATVLKRTLRMSWFNMKIVFGNKFVYFVLASFLFFLFVAGMYIFDTNRVAVEHIYGILLFPGILLLFYPTVFGIQNDADARTLEIIFGIPDYRYKVWLFRIIISFILTFLLLIPMTWIATLAIINFSVIRMVLSLMPSLLITGALGFFLSTLIRNGNGTAVVMVIIGVVFLILGANDVLESSQWNIFLNPYNAPSSMNEILWNEIVMKNRIFLLSATIVFILLGLLNLQRREKFLG